MKPCLHNFIYSAVLQFCHQQLFEALRCPIGTLGRLRLLLSPTTFIAMDIQVARVQGSRLGLQCTHIDLDSVTHLRQLIEHNAQDPALLGRELAVLIGSASGARRLSRP
ncbi:MAG: hypothetical protein EB072_17560 [Betaproteobacteria bacterium]|nr:hypothetical protein [Betaproteobacteria bacterium]